MSSQKTDEAPEIMTCAAALERLQPYRVLIVDDDAAVRRALPGVLQSPLVEVETAANLEEAQQALSRGVDLLITDLRLRDREDTDGFELLSWARRHWPSLPVVVLTAYGSSELRAQAIRLGAVDLWFKSLSMSDFVERLRQLGVPVPVIGQTAMEVE